MSVSAGIGWLAASLLVLCGSVALAAVPPAVADPRDDTAARPLQTRSRAAAPAPSQVPAARPSGNPLWAVPLRKLNASVARPLFAPTRRPPAAVATKVDKPPPPPPPKPREKERPHLMLLGTVAMDPSSGIGLFVDRGDKSVVRLRTGDDHNGWVLRSVAPRQVVLEKGDEKIVLSLPPPEAAGPPGPALPASAPVAAFKPNPPAPVAAPVGGGPSATALPVPPAAAPGGPPPAPSGNPFSGMVQHWMNRISGQPGAGAAKP